MEKCARTHTDLAPDVQQPLERAFARVRRHATLRRLTPGGRPMSDAECARFIEDAVGQVCDKASRLGGGRRGSPET